MVTVSALPSTLMPSGSSVASKSARATARPGNPSEGTVTRTTRRLAVRPVNCPSSFGFMLRLAASHVIGRHRNSVIRQTGTAQT